ncbi:MAG: type ISP restriction/modification enzyme, partial [Anaerobiospirillum sp.]|nr:type ISP restriction/modification enzyme [Anaerobiospirillum sp.]
DESNFTRIHDDEYIKGAKRLYMTATPKVYGEAAKQQESVGEAILYSMDDENVFGPVFSTLNFDRSVKLGCLVDYKVIILVGDKSLLQTDEQLLDFSQYHAAKVIGTWKALNKYGVSTELSGDEQPMRRAVGFAQLIDSKGKYDKAGSKQFTKYFNDTVEHYREHIKELSLSDPNGRASEEFAYLNEHNLVCDCKHIDGSMDAITKGQLLDWLRTDPEENHCKILFNVRCLSEGVDVPALDAVVFLSPRKSQVDVVQTVGRVMRTAPGKTRGYVIIPVVTNDLEHPESIFDKNQSFDVVWQVLNALKSINPDHVLVDGATQKIDERIEVICVQKDEIKGKRTGPRPPVIHHPKPRVDPTTDPADPDNSKDPKHPGQGSLFDFDKAIKVEETIKSTIIKKLGRRKEWQDWAEDVAKICTEQVKSINKLLDANKDPDFQAEFAKFCLDLNDSIGQHLDRDEIIDMLAQHIVIKPVLDELFRGFPFTEQNPIAKGLSDMLVKLDAEGLTKTNQDLLGFYQSVEFRMQNVTTVEDRQKVIVDLFDRFFKVAFPKQQDKLGIVYTPIEVVDFINHSVNDILKKEFGSSLGSHGVHIMDPFTGTGTFITRMMQSPELISSQELEHKYRHELNAQEILPLAYYVASINIESVYHDMMSKDAAHYERNRIVVLTDTFSEVEDKAHSITGSFGDNSELRDAVRALPLKVIVGNPPYSAGQNSANDDNQNASYPELEKRIGETYVEQAGAIANKNSLYDSYIKAFRWASDRLGDQGVIAFVSNAGWIDTAASCGMRRCLQQEFSSVYVYHLKGNARTSGEQRQKEGGNVFDVGSRAPIAITILVKNPQAQEQGKIYFAAVDDYLSREEKLGHLIDLGSILNAPLADIHPDDHGDWLNQRREDFGHFITVDGKKTKALAIFDNFSRGMETSRDAWSYNASRKAFESSFTECIAFYNSQVKDYQEFPESYQRNNDETKIKWSSSLVAYLERGDMSSPYSVNFIELSLYRPFNKLWLYNDKTWIHRAGQMPQLFPYNGAENLVISSCGVGAKGFSCLMSNTIMDLNSMEAGAQCFPRYLYRKISADSTKDAGGLMAGLEVDSEPTCLVINGNERYNRVDAIRPEAVAHFKSAYPEEAAAIEVDAVFYYIYGILHSPDYRATYANNLQKELPRIPRVATYAEFKAFEDAGRALAKLHVGYESVEPYSGCTFSYAKGVSSDNMDYRVEKLKYGKVAGKKGNAAKDKTVIVYNDQLTIRNIPQEAQEYVVNKKSALDWIVERCGVSVDKASHIINDYNDYAAEMGDERYILNLILRVITVSLETVKIVKSLPPLTIHKLDQ